MILLNLNRAPPINAWEYFFNVSYPTGISGINKRITYANNMDVSHAIFANYTDRIIYVSTRSTNLSISYSNFNNNKKNGAYYNGDGGGVIFMPTGSKVVFYKTIVSNILSDYSGIFMRVIFGGQKIVISSSFSILKGVGEGESPEVYDWGLLSYRDTNNSRNTIPSESCFHCYEVRGLVVSCAFYNNTNTLPVKWGFLVKKSSVNFYRCIIYNNKLKKSRGMMFTDAGDTLLYNCHVFNNEAVCYFLGYDGKITLLQCNVDRKQLCELVINADILPFEEAPNIAYSVETITCIKCSVCSYGYNVAHINIYVFALVHPSLIEI